MSHSRDVPARLQQALIGSAVPLAAARTLLGAAVLARPTLLAKTLGVDSATAERTAWLARMFAGRDLALGVGSARGSRGCQVAAVAGDAADFLALAAALKARQVRPLLGALALATAGGAAVIGGAALLITRK